uniref:Uncharacterized protein n=1 Tax=Anguilla anguilla TaxID=7936 RepID=A0A0E9TNJ9_ANGAN
MSQICDSLNMSYRQASIAAEIAVQIL